MSSTITVVPESRSARALDCAISKVFAHSSIGSPAPLRRLRSALIASREITSASRYRGTNGPTALLSAARERSVTVRLANHDPLRLRDHQSFPEPPRRPATNQLLTWCHVSRIVSPARVPQPAAECLFHDRLHPPQISTQRCTRGIRRNLIRRGSAKSVHCTDESITVAGREPPA